MLLRELLPGETVRARTTAQQSVDVTAETLARKKTGQLAKLRGAGGGSERTGVSTLHNHELRECW